MSTLNFSPANKKDEPEGTQKEIWPNELSECLTALLPTAKIEPRCLDLPQPISLWLINPEGMDVPLTGEETNAIFESPPYWSFCWGSGKALAAWIMENPERVQGKTVLDFGSGSGVVAIAAAKMGAKRVIACDIDDMALAAVRHNAVLNNVHLDYLADFFALDECLASDKASAFSDTINESNRALSVDILLAADVLYDPENIPLLEAFREKAETVIVADSRVKNFSYQGFQKIGEQYSITEPDLGEIEDVKTVRFYVSENKYKNVENTQAS